MKRLMSFALICMSLIAGCDRQGSENKAVSVQSFPTQEGPPPLVITNLNYPEFGISGRWRQIEFRYQGKLHVYLQNYDSDNQSMVLVGVYEN